MGRCTGCRRDTRSSTAKSRNAGLGMKPEYPYLFEAGDDYITWGRWRNNANILMLLGLSRRTAEDTAATWPHHSDEILERLDPRRPYRYDDHGAIILE